MSAVRFISSRLRFEGRIPVIATAISYVVIIVSLSVAGGFREEIRRGISEELGDITAGGLVTSSYVENDPVPADSPCLERIRQVRGIREITPVISRAGIIKTADDIYGVMFKGVPDRHDESLGVDIPERLSRLAGLKEGDSFLAYFIGEKVKARRFTVKAVREDMLDTGDNIIVYTNLDDMRRINDWEAGSAAAFEIRLKGTGWSRDDLKEKAAEIGSIALPCSEDGEKPLPVSSSAETYPQIFDWLDLIDFNVGAILILMILVAGVNMISGLLIVLFRNISTIGQLKTLGMSNRGIAGIFLRIASGAVAAGMFAGNAVALAFCLLQKHFHIIRLNPANYFVTYVPIKIDPGLIIATDIISFTAICLFLLLPAIFISKVDPADSIRVS